MQFMYEALARERMQELERQSRNARLLRELAAQRRSRGSRYRRAVESRRARRVSRSSLHQ